MVTTGSPKAAAPAKNTGSLPLTRGRVAALVIGVPACLALVGATGLSTVANFAEGSYPVSYPVPAHATALTLNVTGNLTIRRATAAGQPLLTGTADYTFIRPALTERTSGHTATVGYGCDVPLGNCGLDATVDLPASVEALTTNSGGGDATVTSMTGPVNLSTGGGNLSVSRSSGPVTMNTDGGNVQASALTGPTLSASTGGGNIQADGVTATTITANTDGGNIDESGISAPAVTASTGGGFIKITFTSVPHDVRVNTDDGDITIYLPSGSATYNVTASSDSGSGSVDVGPGIENAHSTDVITASSGGGTVIVERSP